MGLMRRSPSVKWRVFDDGLVVYVPATCETHLLPLELTPLFESMTWELPVVDEIDSETAPPQLVKELINLKILEPIR